MSKVRTLKQTQWELKIEYNNNNSYLCGQSLHIFWSANDPPSTLLRIIVCPSSLRASSKLSTRLLKNSNASCCSLRFTGSPHNLKLKATQIRNHILRLKSALSYFLNSKDSKIRLFSNYFIFQEVLHANNETVSTYTSFMHQLITYLEQNR